MEQMCFSGSSACANFRGNPFRPNLCALCQSKIQDHSGASSSEIVAAIEYVDDKVPSLIVQGLKRSIFMGGFKAAINFDFLEKSQIGLVICTAKDLDITFGRKYQKAVLNREQRFPHITVSFNFLSSYLYKTVTYGSYTLILVSSSFFR